MPLAFSLSLTVASRLLHPYRTDEETSRFTVKQFSTVRDAQRDSQSYIGEEKREEGDRGDQEEKRGSQKWGESNLASNQISMCSPQPGKAREVHGDT